MTPLVNSLRLKMQIREFDPIKSQSNKQKHGISFEEANELLRKSQGLIFLEGTLNWTRGAAGKLKLEGRSKVLFQDGIGGYWLCIYIELGDDLIRPISIHRLCEDVKGAGRVDIAVELVEGLKKVQFDPIGQKAFWEHWKRRLAFRKKRNSETEKKIR